MPPTDRSTFLIEAWIERREIIDLPRLVRARIRDLETGTQNYVKSHEEIGQFILSALAQGSSLEIEWEREL